ncbi:MAG: CYTH domain-containing protein [Candidatus Microsaccharimonas sp.]
MATEIELERTYLVKALPDNLDTFPSEIIHDIYVPAEAFHPHLRLRHRGSRYEITKKVPTDGTDSSKQFEHTIELEKEEFEALAKAPSKEIKKQRYTVEIDGRHAELDVYLDKLAGLVVIDFEFDNEDEMRAFHTPDIALADVTQDETIAAGFLAGKSLADIQPQLEKYGFVPVNG